MVMSRSRSQIGGCNRKTGESRCEQFKGTSTNLIPLDRSKREQAIQGNFHENTEPFLFSLIYRPANSDVQLCVAGTCVARVNEVTRRRAGLVLRRVAGVRFLTMNTADERRDESLAAIRRSIVKLEAGGRLAPLAS